MIATSDWQALPSSIPPLSSTQVHVWSLPQQTPHGQEERFASWLDEYEQKRWQRYKFPRLRDDFLAGHGWLRAILSLYTAEQPKALVWGQQEEGKPTLLSPNPTDLRFNLSHSEGQWLLAVTLGREIGVDIEAVREMQGREGIVERFYSYQERKVYLKLPEKQKLRAFFDVWARKEAFLKATGQGLLFPLERFSITVTGPPALLDVAGDPAALKKWKMATLPTLDGYALALMTEGEVGEVTAWRAETEEVWNWWQAQQK